MAASPFGGIGTAVGSYFGGPVGGAIGGALGGMLDNDGVDDQNAWNAGQAQKQMDFQERMRATQWQTTVSDMKAAGINPMVAYHSGGAGNLTGAMAAPSANKPQIATNNSATAIQAQASAAQIENTRANTELAKATALKTAEETALTASTAQKVRQDSSNAEITAEKLGAEIENVKSQTNTNITIQTLNVYKYETEKTQAALNKGQLTQTEANAKLIAISEKLKQLEVPGAKNTADFEKAMSTGGGNATTAAQKLGNILNSAKKVMGK